MSTTMRDQFNVETPLKCPVCRKSLVKTRIRDMGSITRHTLWEMHSGLCEEHGWFQAEIVGRPPSDIFAVGQPFGTSRRLIVDGREFYQFRTTWDDVDFDVRMNKEHPVNPLDPQYWEPRELE